MNDAPALTRSSDDGSAIVVVHCSDPRYQPHFQHFLRNDLGLEHYALVAVPGGAQVLTLVTYLPKFAWSGWRWMKFLMDLTAPSRIILIAHDDCRWYLERGFEHEPARLRSRLESDLKAVRRALVERFGPVSVDLYFARLQGTNATFDRIVG